MATIAHARRRFGIEIECVFPETYGIVDDFGREFPTTQGYRPTRTAWNIHHDASLPAGGLEFSSPILHQRGHPLNFKHLKNVMDWIKGHGGYVTAACGMHVHIELRDLTNPEIRRLAYSWHANQPHINMLVDKSRHDNGYCPPLSYHELRMLDEAARNPAIRIGGYDRGAFNLCALPEHGTIEFRQHHGSVDFAEAEGWIKFLLGFVRNSIDRKKPMPPYKELKTLINRAKPSKTVEKILNTKIEKSLRGEGLLQLRPNAPIQDTYTDEDEGFYEDEDWIDDDDAGW